MSDQCTHDVVERDVAANWDGFCPLCLQDQCTALRGALAQAQQEIARQSEHSVSNLELAVKHAKQLDAAEQQLATVRAAIREMGEAYRAYDAACHRAFGVSTRAMNHEGRAGKELNESR